MKSATANDRVSKARLYVVLGSMLIGTTGTAQALGPDGATPVGVGAVRALVGAAAMWLFVRGASWRTVARSPVLIGIGAIGVAVYQPAFFFGVDRLGVAMGTILAIGSGPAFAGLIDWVLGRRPSSNWLIGTAMAVGGGTAITLASAGGDIDFDLAGLCGALAAGLGYAVYATTANVLGRRGENSTEVLSWQFTIGSLALVPVLFVEPMGWLGSPGGIVMALHLGVVTIAVAYWLIGYGLERLDTPTVTTLIQAEPVTASVLAVVVLDETLPLIAWVGVALVVLGLVVATAPARRLRCSRS